MVERCWDLSQDWVIQAKNTTHSIQFNSFNGNFNSTHRLWSFYSIQLNLIYQFRKMFSADFIQFVNWVALNRLFFGLNCPTLIPIFLNTWIKRLLCIILCSFVLSHHLVKLNFSLDFNSFSLEFYAWILLIPIWFPRDASF